MTRVVQSIQDWNHIRGSLKGSVGFIPTMGALHQGHLDLMATSKKENDITVVSIFVNPTQFNNSEDFEKYPVSFENDLKELINAKVDYLLYPNYKEIYSDNYKFKITENHLSKTLCGQHRPGHFDGVLTVVMKLLNIVRPTKAYFGEKDFQQYLLVKNMTEAFFMNVKIEGLPTVRDENGLALSSRNVRLSPQGMQKATRFAKLLQRKDLSREQIKNKLEEDGIQVEYLEEVLNRRFAAVQVDGVRLIDNVSL